MKKRIIGASLLLAFCLSMSGCDSIAKFIKSKPSEEDILNWKKGASKATVEEFIEMVSSDAYIEGVSNPFTGALIDAEVDYDTIYAINLTDENLSEYYNDKFDTRFDYDEFDEAAKEQVNSLAKNFISRDLGLGIDSISVYRGANIENYYNCDFEAGAQSWYYETDKPGFGICAYIDDMNQGFVSVNVYGISYEGDSLLDVLEDSIEAEELPFEITTIEDGDVDLDIKEVSRTKASKKDLKNWQETAAKEVTDDLYTLMADEEFLNYLTFGKEDRIKAFNSFSDSKIDEDYSFNFVFDDDELNVTHGPSAWGSIYKMEDLPSGGQKSLYRITESLMCSQKSDYFVEYTIVRRVYECDYKFDNQVFVYDTDTEGCAVIVYFMTHDNGLSYVSAQPLMYDSSDTLEDIVKGYLGSYGLSI